MKTIIYLVLIIVSVSIFGADTIDIREERRVDIEPTKEEIEEYLRNKEEINSHVNENDIQDKKLLKTQGGTKSQSDFDYLEGYNLSTATFRFTIDETTYKDSFEDNLYIPQGLSKDIYGNLLITMYEKHRCYEWCDFIGWCWTDCSSEKSIVVRYDPQYNEITNVYILDDISEGSHVGGIGYYSKEFFSIFGGTYYVEYFFISDSNTIRIYKVAAQNLVLVKVENIPHKNSVMSSSNGYLWVAQWMKPGDDIPEEGDKYLTGYKIDYYIDINHGGQISLGKNYTMNSDELTPNYSVLQPKLDLQGVYCLSDPEVEDRLKFYFSVSGNITYVSQAVLVTKDFNENQIIDAENEYYWESFYSPYGYESGSYRKLPDGGEGIVMKDNKLWMINEGATDYYCNQINWPEDDIDCAREILVIDPVYPDGYETNPNNKEKIFPSGSIALHGLGLDDWGHKVAIVFAQNKLGQFYYAIGNFPYYLGSFKMYFNKPIVPNPVGKQNVANDRATVFVEDIKGIYFMNLNEYNVAGNSDDFYFSQLDIIFDDTSLHTIPVSSLYDEIIPINEDFGDTNTDLSSGDKETMFISFDITDCDTTPIIL